MKKALPILLIAVILAGAVATTAGAKTRKKKPAVANCPVRCNQPYYQGANIYGDIYDDADIQPVYRTGLQPVSIIVNGYLFDIRGLLINGHTYVPLRGVFERLGAEVTYINYTGEIIIRYGSRSLVLQLGSNAARNYNTVYYLDAAPVMVKGHAYVPLRFVSNFLGVHLDWNYYDNTVRITSGKYYREPYYFVW